MCKKDSYGLSAAIVLAVIVMASSPMMGTAGSLEPSAAPAPTMKTLDHIPPAWSQTLPAAQRFELVLNNAGVLDKETGLVWEKSPSTSPSNWNNAIHGCANKNVGGRTGWHLPTIEQLMSLVDRSIAGSPLLPAGHPFIDVQPDPGASYWSASTRAISTNNAYQVNFFYGSVNYSDKTGDGQGYYYAWCVRGGQSHDAY